MRRYNWIALSVSLSVFLSPFSNSEIVTRDGKPLPEVAKIFKLFSKCLSSAQSLPKETLTRVLANPEAATIEDLTALSQEKFLRPKNSERSESSAYVHYRKLAKCLTESEKKQVRESFRKMGDLDAVNPKSKNFDYILINGSTVQDMRTRIMVLAQAIQSGTVELKPSTRIVFLDGERKLYASETEAVLIDPAPFQAKEGWKPPENLPNDERDAAEFVWNQLDLPKSLAEKVPLFIHAEKKMRSRRAETEDCVMKWAKIYSPKPGKALIVSTNPFVYYQTLVTQQLLLQANLSGMQLESIGKASSLDELPEDGELGILLDNLARNFYSYLKLEKANAKTSPIRPRTADSRLNAQPDQDPKRL